MMYASEGDMEKVWKLVQGWYMEYKPKGVRMSVENMNIITNYFKFK